MKTPPGMSKTVTHRLLIADRSTAGIAKVVEILEIFPPLEDRIAIWRASTDQFLIIIMDEEGKGRVGSVRAKDLKHLMTTIEELFDTHLLPPANPAFDIFVAPPDNKAIYDYTAKLLLATVAVLERGISP